MKVIKKNGQHESFHAAKLALSAINSARDLSINMSDREGELIAADVKKMVEKIRGEDGLTSIYELRTLLGSVLNQFGYKKVAQRYLCGSLE